jgi:hypothetical protein
LVYDRFRGVCVLFGGTTLFEASNETWEWDGESWFLRDIGGPSPRVNPAMGYDSARRVALLFGGYLGTDFLGDTWEWMA